MLRKCVGKFLDCGQPYRVLHMQIVLGHIHICVSYDTLDCRKIHTQHLHLGNICQPGKIPGSSRKEPIILVSHLRFTTLISPSPDKPRFFLGMSMITANHFLLPLCRNTRKLGYLAKRFSPVLL